MPDPLLQLADEYRRALLRRERKAAVRLIDAYGRIWDRLAKNLAVLNQEIAAARARNGIVNQSWLFRQRRFADLLRQVDIELKKFSSLTESTITRQQELAEKAGLGDALGLMAAAADSAGISATFNKLPAAAIENQVVLLQNGTPLKGLLDQFPRQSREIVSQALIESVALGINPRQTAARIRKALGINLNRALTISRTETLRAYRTATIQTYQANSGVITGWYWRSSRSRRCCAACVALDGTFHSVSEPMKPHPRCRCTLIPGVKGVTVDKGTTWFNKQPAETQRDIIGTDSGYKAFKSGELGLKDFVGLQSSPMWGDHYHQLSVKRAKAGAARFPQDAPK